MDTSFTAFSTALAGKTMSYGEISIVLHIPVYGGCSEVW